MKTIENNQKRSKKKKRKMENIEKKNVGPRPIRFNIEAATDPLIDKFPWKACDLQILLLKLNEPTHITSILLKNHGCGFIELKSLEKGQVDNELKQQNGANVVCRNYVASLLSTFYNEHGLLLVPNQQIMRRKGIERKERREEELDQEEVRRNHLWKTFPQCTYPDDAITSYLLIYCSPLNSTHKTSMIGLDSITIIGKSSILSTDINNKITKNEKLNVAKLPTTLLLTFRSFIETIQRESACDINDDLQQIFTNDTQRCKNRGQKQMRTTENEIIDQQKTKISTNTTITEDFYKMLQIRDAKRIKIKKLGQICIPLPNNIKNKRKVFEESFKPQKRPKSNLSNNLSHNKSSSIPKMVLQKQAQQNQQTKPDQKKMNQSTLIGFSKQTSLQMLPRIRSTRFLDKR